ncbi:MAG: hypothetical protein US69_C0006G0017 [candidate division TM6 bacterium GW2011_GWF2_38_10]|nr:MAG: hypothetical protein US69_C0006G0017 [candidate division TM6 bacterium GW2011_GWF2_38_10]
MKKTLLKSALLMCSGIWATAYNYPAPTSYSYYNYYNQNNPIKSMSSEEKKEVVRAIKHDSVSSLFPKCKEWAEYSDIIINEDDDSTILHELIKKMITLKNYYEILPGNQLIAFYINQLSPQQQYKQAQQKTFMDQRCPLHLLASNTQKFTQQTIKKICEISTHVINAYTNDFITPLLTHIFFQRNLDYDFIKALLESGANPNIPNKQGVTPLYALLNQNDEDVRYNFIALLLDYKADVNALIKFGRIGFDKTPYEKAHFHKKNAPLTYALIEQYKNATDQEKPSLGWIIQNIKKEKEFENYMLQAYGWYGESKFTEPNYGEDSVLHLAIQHNNVHIINFFKKYPRLFAYTLRKLVSHKNQNGDTALLMAIKENKALFASRLITIEHNTHCSFINEQDSNGNTALHVVAQKINQNPEQSGWGSVIQNIIKQQYTFLNIKNNDGLKAHELFHDGNYDIFIQECAENQYLKPNYTMDILYFSLENNKEKVSLELLQDAIQHNIDINAYNSNGCTILQEAIFNNVPTSLISLLMQHGANPHLIDKSQKTAFDYANKYMKKIAPLLTNH